MSSYPPGVTDTIRQTSRHILSMTIPRLDNARSKSLFYGAALRPSRYDHSPISTRGHLAVNAVLGIVEGMGK